MMHSTNDFWRFLSQPLLKTLKDSIYQEMNAFKRYPNSGDSPAFCFEQQTAMLQNNMLAKGTAHPFIRRL